VSAPEILFLAHRLPYPPDRGDRIRSWHMLRALAKLGPVHVVTPLDGAEDRQHIAKVESIAASVTAAVRPPSKGIAVARALLTGLPASVALFSVPVLHRAVRARLATGRIGTIFAFSGQMAHYVPVGSGAKFLMDFVDMDSAKFAQQGGSARGLSGLALRQEAKRLLAFETATARRADASLFVSESEATLFATTTGLRAQVIENGVDATHFAPGAVVPAEAPHPLVVFTGQMDYAPNIAAVTDFVRDVLPLLPRATFAIVGRAPAAAVKALAAPNVVVTGEVPDTRPWLAAADVVVAPLTLARGIQNKVLEAMAMGKPVVASPAAAEGIDAEVGVELLVAGSPAMQAAAIGALLTDPLHARSVGTAARDRVLARYSWDACLAPLSGLVG
jgi:sugar transferase (PEP-CTERM/EpsH1 system associated)